MEVTWIAIWLVAFDCLKKGSHHRGSSPNLLHLHRQCHQLSLTRGPRHSSSFADPLLTFHYHCHYGCLCQYLCRHQRRHSPSLTTVQHSASPYCF